MIYSKRKHQKQKFGSVNYFCHLYLPYFGINFNALLLLKKFKYFNSKNRIYFKHYLNIQYFEASWNSIFCRKVYRLWEPNGAKHERGIELAKTPDPRLYLTQVSQVHDKWLSHLITKQKCYNLSFLGIINVHYHKYVTEISCTEMRYGQWDPVH